MIIQIIHSAAEDDVHWVAADSFDEGASKGQALYGPAVPDPCGITRILVEWTDDYVISMGGVDADFRKGSQE